MFEQLSGLWLIVFGLVIEVVVVFMQGNIITGGLVRISKHKTDQIDLPSDKEIDDAGKPFFTFKGKILDDENQQIHFEQHIVFVLIFLGIAIQVIGILLLQFQSTGDLDTLKDIQEDIVKRIMDLEHNLENTEQDIKLIKNDLKSLEEKFIYSENGLM